MSFKVGVLLARGDITRWKRTDKKLKKGAELITACFLSWLFYCYRRVFCVSRSCCMYSNHIRRGGGGGEGGGARVAQRDSSSLSGHDKSKKSKEKKRTDNNHRVLFNWLADLHFFGPSVVIIFFHDLFRLCRPEGRSNSDCPNRWNARKEEKKALQLVCRYTHSKQ